MQAEMKKPKYSEPAFAIFDKFGIVPYNGALAIFEEKYDADYQKEFYPKEIPNLKVKPILITEMSDD